MDNVQTGWEDILLSTSGNLRENDACGKVCSMVRHRLLLEDLLIRITRHGGWLCMILVLFILLNGLANSLSKPLWFDEVFTAYFASLRTPAAITEAVKNASDPIPPAFYILEGAFSLLSPVKSLGLRMPALLGTAAAAACIYAFLQPTLGVLSALIGASFLFITAAFTTYAAEARPYGLLIGCTAGAALAWRSAHRSRAAATALCCCLAVATAIHYYAVFITFAFLLSEVWLSFQFKRFRLNSIIAIVAGFTPLMLQWSFLSEARRVFAQYFWARSSLRVLRSIYDDLFPGLWIAVPLVSVLFLLQLYTNRGLLAAISPKHNSPHSHTTFNHSEHYDGITLGVSLTLFMPLVAITATWLTDGGFTSRYGLPVVIGAAISLAYCSANLSPVSRLALLLAFCCFACNECISSLKAARKFISRAGQTKFAGTSTSMGLPMETNQLPLVVSNGLQFLQLEYETPPEQRGRLIFVADPQRAVKFTGSDSVDVGLLRLNNVVPLNLVDYESFRKEYGRFNVVTQGHQSEWLVHQLIRDGCRLSLVSFKKSSSIFLSECDFSNR